ncbi:MAG TPA: SDR family oxidoreductase [Roseiflexaceae bacterium]|nr:SDR family oxidoreductase [Roseiflexaceae bacterium]
MAGTQPHPGAIVCGSDTPIGGALVARLLAAGTTIVTVDFTPAAQIEGVQLRLHGDLLAESTWATFAATIRERGLAPSWLVSTLQSSDAPLRALELPQERWDGVLAHNLRSAYLACKHFMPLMEQTGGAVVLLASVYAEWDVRAEAAAQSASDAGLLALARTLALSGARAGIRVNTVCYGLLAQPEQVAGDARLRAATGRIPLGRATSPEDVVDAIAFLLSPDASYITGSTLVVDGGQALQSWSNAPDAPGYPV